MQRTRTGCKLSASIARRNERGELTRKFTNIMKSQQRFSKERSMHNSERLRLVNAYLDILFSACKKRQYERVEMMIEGAIYDAEQTTVLDSRLVWIMSDLSDYYASNKKMKESRCLLEQSIKLQKNLGVTPSQDSWFQKVALAQIVSGEANATTKSDLYQTATRKVRSLFSSFYKLNGAWHAST
jgi:hypothetical protein